MSKKPTINPLEEQRVSIPWLVIEPQTEGGDYKVLVSTPQGNILEFPIDKEAIQHIGPLLDTDALWNSFFTSVIASLGVREK